jgi:hypothetical protein
MSITDSTGSMKVSVPAPLRRGEDGKEDKNVEQSLHGNLRR